MTDVFTTWQEAGYDAGGFPTALQPFLAAQNVGLVAQTGHWDLNDAAVTALVNAVNAALGG